MADDESNSRGRGDGQTMSAQPALVDTHAHLDDHRYRETLSAVLDRARLAGVVQIVAMGTTAADSARLVALAAERTGVFAAVGVHPNNAAAAGPADWAAVAELAVRPGVVAIGETGLDRHWRDTSFPDQQEWLGRHMDLAESLDLPVVIHCRDATQDCIEYFRRLNRPIRGVMHAFSGTWDDAQALLEMGFHLSFAGMVTFTNKSLDPLREAAANTPGDRLLVETDSPYLTPHPFRGQPNEPARVATTAERLAQIRGVTLDSLAKITTENARMLFRLPEDQLLKPSHD